VSDNVLQTEAGHQAWEKYQSDGSVLLRSLIYGTPETCKYMVESLKKDLDNLLTKKMEFDALRNGGA
jgi:hypothetical protein